MVQGLTDEQRKYLEEQLALAEPYDEDDPEWNTFDGNSDILRGNATLAKKLLEEYPK